MKVLFEVTHPAHVHLFRHSIKELEQRGNKVHVTSRDKDLTTQLLANYNIEHTVLSKKRSGFFSLVTEWSLREIKTLRHYQKLDPDVVVSRFNPAASHASYLLGIPHLVFDDTEGKPAYVRKSAIPFSDVIYTPECFELDLGESQVRYPGYHELAYLHPNRFKPDSGILDEIDTGHVVVLRFVSWDAIHDMGEGGFDDIFELISALERAGATILITAEGDLPAGLNQYQIQIPPHRIHHLLYEADLFFGESATMATESAVLGTPAIFVSSVQTGYTKELEEEYKLVFNYSGENRHQRSLNKAIETLKESKSSKWESRRKKLLNDKIDTTEFILEQIYNILE